jgi:hypothetical protein
MRGRAGSIRLGARMVQRCPSCRRKSTAEIGAIVTTLTGPGIRLHGFGVKTTGLRLYGHYLA